MFITTIIETKKITDKDGDKIEQFCGFKTISFKLTSNKLEKIFEDYEYTETDQFFNLESGYNLTKSFKYKSYNVIITVFKL